MKTYFQADGWVKFYEEDIYLEGCQPNTGGIVDGRESWKAKNLDDLINELLIFTGADYQDIQLDSCDEDGRLDICVMEDENGSRATRHQLEQWKEGKIRLWDCIYTFQVEKITAQRINLQTGAGL